MLAPRAERCGMFCAMLLSWVGPIWIPPLLHRVGLWLPDPGKMLLVACASRAHYAIKLQHLELALSARSRGGDPQPLFE